MVLYVVKIKLLRCEKVKSGLIIRLMALNVNKLEPDIMQIWSDECVVVIFPSINGLTVHNQ